MKKIMKMKTTLVLFLVLMLILSQFSFAAPSVTIYNPSSNGYFLQDSGSLYVRAYVSGSPTSVSVYYSSRKSANDNTFVDNYIGGLTREVNTNYYSKTLSLGGLYKFPRLQFPLFTLQPVFKVVATDSTGTTQSPINGTMTIAYKSNYTSMDNTFYYNSANSNPFVNVSTGHPYYDGVQSSWTYNCMAYAVNRSYQGWIWPWSNNPTDSQLLSEMNRYGFTTANASKTNSKNAKVIYYAGGHFSKVIAWDTNGYPTKIQSKWGGQELINSNSPNPFVNSGYKQAYYYFK